MVKKSGGGKLAKIEAELAQAKEELARFRESGVQPVPPREVKHYFRQWRIHRGFATQADLAKALKSGGMKRETICRLESGAMPYKQWQLEQLADALNTTPGNLISLDPADEGSVFEIYNAVPRKLRPQARRVLPKHPKI